MAKSKEQTKKELAADIAKDVYDVINKHIETKVIYTDSKQAMKNQNITNTAEFLNDMATMFDKKYNVYPTKTLNDMTWCEINNIIAEGNAHKIFKLGDSKTIELYTGEIIEVVILGFYHDTISGTSQKAGVSFGLKNLLDGEFEINEDYTNVGGWAKSKMRNTYMQRFFKLLPNDLQEVIKTVDKITGVGGGSEETETTQDKLFLFSQREVVGYSDYVAPFEGKQYPYFEDADNVIKYKSGSAYLWWLRSPFVTFTTSFRYVSNLGSVYYSTASYACGVAFGFCV